MQDVNPELVWKRNEKHDKHREFIIFYYDGVKLETNMKSVFSFSCNKILGDSICSLIFFSLCYVSLLLLLLVCGFASSSFVRCKALMNAWQLTKSVHNHINKTISLFSSLCFALRVCYVLVTTIATNSLVECLWFGRILLLFQRSDHNTQNEETKKTLVYWNANEVTWFSLSLFLSRTLVNRPR